MRRLPADPRGPLPCVATACESPRCATTVASAHPTLGGHAVLNNDMLRYRPTTCRSIPYDVRLSAACPPSGICLNLVADISRHIRPVTVKRYAESILQAIAARTARLPGPHPASAGDGIALVEGYPKGLDNHCYFIVSHVQKYFADASAKRCLQNAADAIAAWLCQPAGDRRLGVTTIPCARFRVRGRAAG